MSNRKTIKRRVNRHRRNLPMRLRRLSNEDARRKILKYSDARTDQLDVLVVTRNGTVEERHDQNCPIDICWSQCIACGRFYWDECYCDRSVFEQKDDYLTFRLNKVIATASDLQVTDRQPLFQSVVGASPVSVETSPEPLDLEPIHTILPDFWQDVGSDFSEVEDEVVKRLAGRVTYLEKAIAKASASEPENSWFFEKEELFKLSALYSPFWVRDIRDWQGGDLSQLFKHLFVSHDLPDELVKRFLELGLYQHFRFHWLIIMGQGGSLKTAARKFSWSVTGKIQKFLLAAASHPRADAFSFKDHFELAEVLRLGGSFEVYNLLQTHPAFSRVACVEFELIDYPSRYVQGKRRFWNETVDWLTRHERELTRELVWDLLDWADHQFIELRRNYIHGRARRKVWAGRTVRSALAASQAYRDELRRLEELRNAELVAIRWEKKGWCANIEVDSGVWQIAELNSAIQLREEGKRMRHCVGTYHTICLSGMSAIFRLSFNGNPVATVEVCMRNKQIIQAKGPCNQGISPFAEAFLQQWENELLEPRIDSL